MGTQIERRLLADMLVSASTAFQHLTCTYTFKKHENAKSWDCMNMILVVLACKQNSLKANLR